MTFFSDEQLKNHGELILKWLSLDNPLLEFHVKGTTHTWTTVVGTPIFLTGLQYRIKRMPKTIWVNSYNNGSGNMAHYSKTDAIQASRGAPEAAVNYRAKQFVEVL